MGTSTVLQSRKINRIIARTIAVSAACLLGVSVRAGLIDEAVVFYTFEGTGQTVGDVSGTTAIDLQLGSASGVDAQDPTRTTGYRDGGLSFDYGQFATSVTDQAALDFNGNQAFTVAGWFQRADDSVFNYMASKMATTGPYPGWMFTWRRNGDAYAPNGLQFYIRDNVGGNQDGFLSVASVPVTETGWVHLAATYDGTATIAGVTLYLNGNPLAKDGFSQNNGFTTSSVTDNPAPFNIGGRNNTGFLDGFADDVGVWNRKLTQSEIQWLYRIPEPASVLLFVIGGLVLLKRRGRA